MIKAEPFTLVFQKDWMYNPFEEKYKVIEDLGEDEDGNHVYKVEKI